MKLKNGYKTLSSNTLLKPYKTFNLIGIVFVDFKRKPKKEKEDKTIVPTLKMLVNLYLKKDL